MDFDAAFSILVDPEHEGGYVNNPADPGGETKYGISKRAYPNEDIANLTLDRAKVIYKTDFWGPAGCDAVPDAVKFELFDLAVNTSAPGKPTNAIKMLQAALGVPQDGAFGKTTLMAIGTADPMKLLRHLQAYRIRYYTNLPHDWFNNFGKGVMNRIAANILRG